LIGHWRKSLSKPLWVMTTLEPERGLEIYLKRMKTGVAVAQKTIQGCFSGGCQRICCFGF
jgi:hypothetical protein